MTKKIPLITLARKGTHRCLDGHPWVFGNEFAAPLGIESGSAVELADWNGRFIGIGYYNPKSKIAVRIFSKDPEAILDINLIRKRIVSAKIARAKFFSEDEPRRIFFSEGDFLPGLIADIYGKVIVFQILSLGLELKRKLIVEALLDVYKPSAIYERSDSASRSLEGLEIRLSDAYGTTPDRIETESDGVKFVVYPKIGHKTGAYLDQRLNRRRFASYAAGAKVLDAFAYNGLFSLYSAAGGAKELTAIESSKSMTDILKENAEMNGVNIETVIESAFETLKRFEIEGRRFDLISLDPPAFVPRSEQLRQALRGYKELNMRAMKLIEENGVLFTSSCSFHLKREDFIETLKSAMKDTGRNLQLLELTSAAPDHPIRLNIPETDYLKCAVLRAV